MAEKLALSPIEDWYLKVDDIAMVALPPHLDSFMTRDDGGVYHTPLILSLSGEDLWLVSSACPVVSAGYANAHGVPRWLYPPRVTLRIHYPSGRFEWLEPEASAYGGPPLQPDPRGSLYLGAIVRDHLGPTDWIDAVKRYFPLVCRVVERRWLVTAYPTTTEERDTARELQQCVRALYDAPLLPYYHHYGAHFLGWMARAAQ